MSVLASPHFTMSKPRNYVSGMWIRGRPVRALSFVSKDSEFNPSVRPSVVKIANHC